MTRDQGEHGPRWHEGYQLGLRDALTGSMTCILGDGPERLEKVEGYWAGREAGLQRREAAPEAGS
jgi:hypothetical protein